MSQDYWEELKVQPDLDTWLDNWHGCFMCGCDHGCNGWLVQNAGKAYRIIEALQKDNTQNLDSIVQKHINEVNLSIVEDSHERIKLRNENKDE